jgi:hydroxymethylglutaryl-CoA synthase
LAGIVSWGCYIPKSRIKAEEIARAWGNNGESIKESLKVTEKSVPAIDEDTATMAVEAARNAVAARNIDAGKIIAVYIGSESHPYTVKPTGTIIAQAIGMSEKYTTADFEFACKAGTAAIQVACSMASDGYVLAGGADTAQAAPGDILEFTAAAGAAVFIVGEDAAAEINHTVSYTTDTPDFWRRSGQKYPSHGGGFTGEPAYFKHVINATKMLFEKANTSAKDYDYAVFHQPNGKFPMAAARRLGFSKEQVLPGLIVSKIGNAYSASSLLGLCAVLDIAKPGQRILLTSYGSGAGSDSFDITVTEKIKDVKPLKVQDYIGNRRYIEYPKYLRNTGKI